MHLDIDYETYYDDDYSLQRMIRTFYLNDPRFKVHGAAVSLDKSESIWVTGSDMQAFFDDVGPYLTSMCCHNGLFDHAITEMNYLKRRIALRDTMSMAQVALLRQFPGQRMSLAKLAQFYFPNNPEWWKFEGILENFKGVFNLNPTQERNMAKYAKQDNLVMQKINEKLLLEDVPWAIVLRDIDLTLGMGVYPELIMDTRRAAAINKYEEDAKNKAVVEMNIDRASLRSGDKLAALFRAQGVEPPMKKNTKGDKMIYAFAAKDLDFMALAEHENPNVRALQALRLGEKSAQTMTRSATFANLPERLPVPLKVAAAHTGRHGGDEYNLQNLGRKSPLRECIRAANGYKLIVGDLAGIELRVNAWWCDEETLLDAFRNGTDIYSELASTIYGRLITKQTGPDERFVGKTSELACQYGAGEDRIMQALLQEKVPCDKAMAKKIKTAYRSKRKNIVARWRWLQDIAIPALAGHTAPVEKKGVRFEHGRVVLPSGRSLWYPELYVNGEGDWMYKTVKKAAYFKKIYGGALLENIIQAMSYDIFMFQQRLAADILKPLAMAVHDEGVFVFPDAEVPRALPILEQIYQCGPEWFRGVPIFGEFGVGQTYAECK
jgi:DNA polymerase